MKLNDISQKGRHLHVRRLALAAAPAALFALLLSGGMAAAQQAVAPLSSTDPVYQLRGTTSGGVAPAAEVFDEPVDLDGNLGGEQDPETQNAPLMAPIPSARPVSVEEPQQGRVRPEPRVQPLADLPEEGAETLANPPAGPIETGVPTPQETDPFLPAGFRAGTWNVFARLEQALGYSTNTSQTPDGKPGAVSITSGNLRMQSDWSRHEASIEAKGAVEQGLSGDADTIPDASIEGRLRLDVVDGYAVNLRAGYDYNTENGSSGTSGRYDVQEFGGSAELLRGGRKLELSVKGSADRTLYGDLDTGTGVVTQDDRNNTLFQLTGRAGYAVSPALKPFLQAGIGRRLHDPGSTQSDGTIYDLRAGVAVDLGEKLRGEAALGYLTEDYNDPAVKTAHTPSLNASLFWSPVRGTNVTLTAATGLDSASAAGESGSVSQSLSATARTQLTHRLAAKAEGSIEFDNYENGGSDRTYSLGAGLEYAVSRYLALTGNVGYEDFEAATKGGSWDATTVTLGLALQR